MNPPPDASRRPLLVPAAAALSLLLLSACHHTTNNVGDNLLREINQTVTEIRTNVTAVKTSQENLESAQKTFEETSQKQLQIAADRVGGASYVTLHNDPQNPYTQLAAQELSIAAASLPPASTDNEARIIADLKAALSNDQLQIAELKRRQEVALAEAAQARNDRNTAQVAMGAAQAEVKQKTEILEKTVVKLDDAEQKAKLANALADDAEARKRAAENAKARLHIAYAFMAGGGLLIVAAIVATALRVPGVLAAGLAAGGALVGLGWIMTVLNEWLQNLWFRVGIGVILLGAFGVGVLTAIRAVRTRRQAEMDAKIGTGAIGALQEARNDDAKLGRNTFATIEPYLKEWFVDDAGNPDLPLDQALKERLVKMNLINPEGAAAHVVPNLRRPADGGN